MIFHLSGLMRTDLCPCNSDFILQGEKADIWRSEGQFSGGVIQFAT